MDHLRKQQSAVEMEGVRSPVAPDASIPLLPAEQAILLKRYFELIPIDPSSCSPAHGLLRELRDRIETSADPILRQHLHNLGNDLHTYFSIPSADHPELNEGQIIVIPSEDGFSAVLTLIPPRAGGSVPTLSTIMSALEKKGINHGIKLDAINLALETVLNENDLAWQWPIAKGEPPLAGRLAHVEFQVRVVDKVELRKDCTALSSFFEVLGAPFREGLVVGRRKESRSGIAGHDIFGQTLYPLALHSRSLELGVGLKLTDNLVTAQASGHIFTDGARVDLVPLYVVEDPAPRMFEDFTFDGSILVKGALKGPGTIQCEDLFVLGNCEQMNVSARGDVFVSGGIVGHRQSLIDADGGIYASFISESAVSALGEIVVTNAIINSQAVSTDSIRILSKKGMIIGGSIQAMKQIVVPTIGSEFGMLTETVVGKDFLTSQRLADIAAKINLHEDNLRRIQDLKSQMARAHVQIARLPPDKQEIYIGVLRKEQRSQVELRSLVRRKNRLTQSLNDFLSASIRVLDGIYPPVRVRIVDQITEITRRLNAVTMQYDKKNGIVSDFSESQPGDST